MIYLNSLPIHSWDIMATPNFHIAESCVEETSRDYFYHKLLVEHMQFIRYIYSFTWALTKDQSRKLANSQRRMERSILNISLKDKIRNETIRERTKVKHVIETVRDLKSRWAGHVARVEDKKWAKITTEWYQEVAEEQEEDQREDGGTRLKRLEITG